MRTPTIRTIVLGSGEKQIQTVGGQVFAVISATGTFTVQADQREPVPMTKGRGFGQPGAGDFSRLVFVDTSGSTNTITFYAGDEPFAGADQLMTVSFASGASVSIAAANLATLIAGLNPVALAAASLLSITPADATVTPGWATQSNTSVAYTGKKAIKVWNTGATDITVAGGTLSPGENIDWSVFRQQDTLASVTVDATGGGEAKVAYLS